MSSRLERALERARKVPGLARRLADVVEAVVEDAEQADRDYEKFHWGRAPTEATWERVPNVRPGDVLSSLGELSEVAYETKKGGEHAIYVHAFDAPKPHLGATSDGGLVIVGGNYRVTRRGIVG